MGSTATEVNSELSVFFFFFLPIGDGKGETWSAKGLRISHSLLSVQPYSFSNCVFRTVDAERSMCDDHKD